MFSFKSTIGRLQHLIGMHYVAVPAPMVRKLGGLSRQRYICSINNTVSFKCGMVALGEGQGYISINKARLKQLGVVEHDEVSVMLEPEQSELGMDMPEELDELLKQDPEGSRRFNLLPKGKRRYIVYYVSQVKSINLRIERAMTLIGNLKRLPEGKEEFRDILGKKRI